MNDVFVGNSQIFIQPPISTVPGQLPQPKNHVFVEHSNGLFIPLEVHRQIETRQQIDAELSRGIAGGASNSWNFQEDAKDYIDTLMTVMKFLRRLLDMLSALACGFTLFKVLDVYAVPDSRSGTTFLQAYSGSVDILPKCFLFLCILLVLLSLFPMAYDLAMRNLSNLTIGTTFSVVAQRNLAAGNGGALASGVLDMSYAVGSNASIGGSAANNRVSRSVAGLENPTAFGAQQSKPVNFAKSIADATYQRLTRIFGLSDAMNSPFRHMMQVRFICFCGALAMTIIEIAVVDQQKDLIHLSPALEQNLHAAILVRAGLFALGWLFSLRDF